MCHLATPVPEGGNGGWGGAAVSAEHLVWELTLCGFVVHLFLNPSLSSFVKLGCFFPSQGGPMTLSLSLFERMFLVYPLAVSHLCIVYLDHCVCISDSM